jgi:hypothetical protein
VFFFLAYPSQSAAGSRDMVVPLACGGNTFFANFSAHLIRAVICITTNSVRIEPIV